MPINIKKNNGNDTPDLSFSIKQIPIIITKQLYYISLPNK